MGTDDYQELQPFTDSWLPLAREIRARLGPKGYLLENYLGYVFSGLQHTLIDNMVCDSESAASLLTTAIRHAMAGDAESGKKNPLYPQVKEYVEAHPLPWQEEWTRVNFYYAALAGLLPAQRLSWFIQQAKPPVKVVDIVRVRELYREIGSFLGELASMDRLDERIHACFQITDPAHIFLQGTVGALLFSLTWRDDETSRQVFQLLLDREEEMDGAMIYVTGDTHGDFSRFRPEHFPEQQSLIKEDYVIVCGDFGIWDDSEQERGRLDWLNAQPFTTLFVAGNHSNYDRLMGMPVTRWKGGDVQFVRDIVIHLMRGQVYVIEGKRIFAMGGASSHDIDGGILEPDDPEFRRKRRELDRRMVSTMYPGGGRSCPVKRNTPRHEET